MEIRVSLSDVEAQLGLPVKRRGTTVRERQNLAWYNQSQDTAIFLEDMILGGGQCGVRRQLVEKYSGNFELQQP